ncbi:MAG: serine protease [Verrucomicrobiota bacterium]
MGNYDHIPFPLRLGYEKRLERERVSVSVGGGEVPGVNVVGGGGAQAGEYPFMVALVASAVPDEFQAHFCAGALVHPYWVVTAAHCVSDLLPSELEAVVGAHDLNSIASTARIAVAEILVHDDYDAGTFDTDLALIRLESPAPIGIAPVPLIDESTLSAPGVMATVLGWGATDTSETVFPSILQEGEVPIVPLATANATAVYNGSLTGNHLPAGFAAGGVDTCSGDSGGPLLVPSPLGPTGSMLAGITSFGRGGCGQPNAYGIYTRLLNHRLWIMKHLYPHYGVFEEKTGALGEFRDRDGDGINGLGEFAFRGLPLNGWHRGAVELTTYDDAGALFPALRIRRPVGAGELTYGLEHSDEIGTWAPVDFGANVVMQASVPGDPDGEELTIKGLGPIGLTGPALRRGFLRANVEFSRDLVLGERCLDCPGTETGALRSVDPAHPVLPNRVMKLYRLRNLVAGQGVMVTLRTQFFDAYLEIVNAATGSVVASASSNDAGGLTDKDEILSFVPQSGIEYLARVTSSDIGGEGQFLLCCAPASFPTISLSNPVNGVLSTGDPVNPIFPTYNRRHDDYRFVVFSKQSVEVNLTSSAFDAMIEVIDECTGQVVAVNDDTLGGTNSHVCFVARPDMRYLIRATTAALPTPQLGAYTLTLSPDPAATIGTPASAGGALANGDCRIPSLENPAQESYMRRYFIGPYSDGEVVNVAVNSSDIDLTVDVYAECRGALCQRAFVASNDQAWIGTNNSEVSFFAEANQVYVVEVSSFGPFDTGSFTIVTGNNHVTIFSGETFNGSLSTLDDMFDPTGGSNFAYYDHYYPLDVAAGETATVTMNSGDFDTLLIVYDDVTGALIGFDDDGGSGTNSQFSFTPAAGQVPIIIAMSAFPSTTGSYSISMSKP